MHRILLACVAWLVSTTLSPAGAAEERKYSQYEKESLRRGLEAKQAEIDLAPEGKIVEGIDVVTLEVIEDRDPAPGFLNWFHVTSRQSVIAREVLLRPGMRFERSLMEESERNLRVRQLSVVLVVPVEGSAPDRVRLLVVTKDVWSLRMNWQPRFLNGKLDYLALQPSEENLFGNHKIVTGLVELTRATYSAGLGYVDPRVGGSRLGARMSANLIFNCQTGDLEGTEGLLSYGKPLYSTRTRWAWSATVTWLDNIGRPAGAQGNSICAGGQAALLDFASTPDEFDRIPYEFEQSVLRGELAVTRSYGIRWKHDISFGLESRRAAYAPRSENPLPSNLRATFLLRLPTNDTRISPFVQLHSYENRYLRVVDLNTLGLQEDYQLGHDVWIRLYPAAKDVGSSRNLLGIYSGVGYTIPVADGLVRAYGTSNLQLSSRERPRPGFAERSTSDAQLSAGVRLVTPRSVLGRLVYDAVGILRPVNYLNPVSVLGGDTRLRGYRPSVFVGSNLVASNLEFRSRAVQILSVQVGGVLFWDAGHVTSELREFDLQHGAGAGLRFLFPQLDRTVFRIDAGFPLNARSEAAETTVIAQFYQAFGMPRVNPPGLVPAIAPADLNR